jgi:hypothetical protein
MEMSGLLRVSGRFIPGGRAGTHWLGSCLGPRFRLDAREKREIVMKAKNMLTLNTFKR